MKLKIANIIIMFLFLVNVAYVPCATAFFVVMNERPAVQTAQSANVINHSSFVQIPGQVLKMCVKISNSLQAGLFFMPSSGETVIKKALEFIKIDMILSDRNLKPGKKLMLFCRDASVNIMGEPLSNNGIISFLLLFIASQMLLHLLVVRKGSLPYAVLKNNIYRTRYQF
jgi:hypothetical protein